MKSLEEKIKLAQRLNNTTDVYPNGIRGNFFGKDFVIYDTIFETVVEGLTDDNWSIVRGFVTWTDILIFEGDNIYLLLGTESEGKYVFMNIMDREHVIPEDQIFDIKLPEDKSLYLRFEKKRLSHTDEYGSNVDIRNVEIINYEQVDTIPINKFLSEKLSEFERAISEIKATM